MKKLLFVLMLTSLSVAQQWAPKPLTTWNYQIGETPTDLAIQVQAYDIDGFDNDAAQVQKIHAAGSKAICYIDVGTWENWRPDAGEFPNSVKGNKNGWPGEKWLDIRQLNILGPIITARFQMCQQKGFDAIEADNVDGYTNSTGFPLNGAGSVDVQHVLCRDRTLVRVTDCVEERYGSGSSAGFDLRLHDR